MVELKALELSDREQFIKDNQEAFNYGAMQEFGMRDDHFEEDDQIISRDTIEKSIDAGEASFTLDGFYFRMLSQNEYKLYYPKTIAFIGVSEGSKEIAYVFYNDVDLDYIGSSFPDFLIEDCGWE